MMTSEREANTNEGGNQEHEGRTKKTRVLPLRYFPLFVVLFLLLVAAAIFVPVFVAKAKFELLGTISDPGKSCLDLKLKGVDKSGYYYLESYGVNGSYEVYCDMETSGGGWTLVASVHQYNNEDKCTDKNMWYGSAGSIESRNWENNNTFGEAANATSADYKSPAYFSLTASNIMISHVGNNHRIERRPPLQYQTENNFLTKNGGNLYKVFNQRYPLTPTDSGAITSDKDPSVLEEILDALAKEGSNLYKVTIPPLYRYVYDDQYPDRLSNGGNNLFEPYGMKITIEGPNCEINGIIYGRNYTRCGNLASRKSYPFFALLETGNTTDPPYLYTIDSKRRFPQSAYKQTYYKYASNRFYEMFYHATCESNYNTPSFCDLVFTVSSRTHWNSSYINDRIISNFRKTSSHTNAVYGYTLIAREAPWPNTEIPIVPIAHRILDVLSNFSAIDIQLMLNSLVDRSSYILDVDSPPPYEYGFEQEDPAQDRLSSDQDLFRPYGMKVEAFTSRRNQSIEYGKTYKFSDDLIEISSKKSFPFFVLMKMNNPNLLAEPVGLRVKGGRSRYDRRSIINNPVISIGVGTYIMHYDAHCSLNETLPSICDVIYVVTNSEKWHSKYITRYNFAYGGLGFPNRSNNNVSQDYMFYEASKRSEYANAIMGYTLLSRQPGNVFSRFPLSDIMTNTLSIFAKFPFIGSPCSNPARNLVAPVTFTAGYANQLKSAIPRTFQSYAPTGYIQLRAATFNGQFYALCPGVRVETCEPQHICVGGVRKETEEQLCNAYLNWPANGTSYTSPRDINAPPRTAGEANLQSNILIFYG